MLHRITIQLILIATLSLLDSTHSQTKQAMLPSPRGRLPHAPLQKMQELKRSLIYNRLCCHIEKYIATEKFTVHQILSWMDSTLFILHDLGCM